MESCTITQTLRIVPGTRQDYESLTQYHYRECNVGPYAAIFALKGKFRTAEKIETVGVIVYAMPAAGCQLRSVATGGLFAGLDKSSRLKLIGKNIRTISRVIIEPRFRSLGLAARIVRETMPLMNVPFIEALAVMGRVRLIEAFGTIGIDERDLIDPRFVQQKIDGLQRPSADFIEREIVKFLQGYGRRRLMKPGIERTGFITGKLTDRPVYYLWKNPNVELRI